MVCRLVSLGAWCRPAYQLNSFAERHDFVEAGAYPFDWTVTKYASLKQCLSSQFNTDLVLRDGHITASEYKSGVCDTTGLIFQHALSRAALTEVLNVKVGEKIDVTGEAKPLVEDARGRFSHTFQRLLRLKQHFDGIVFVRWRRMGHPDGQLPDAFDAESNESLAALVEDFLQHRNFFLLSVESQYTADRKHEFRRPVERFSVNGNIAECLIHERKGWNGDQSKNFRGDEHSWSAALTRALQAFDVMGAA